MFPPPHSLGNCLQVYDTTPIAILLLLPSRLRENSFLPNNTIRRLPTLFNEHFKREKIMNNFIATHYTAVQFLTGEQFCSREIAQAEKLLIY